MLLVSLPPFWVASIGSNTDEHPQKTGGKQVMLEQITKFFKDEEGASAIEYGLLVALIAVVMAVGATTMGTKLDAMFTTTAAKLP
jgi:pilus assembly protein Flp/PilA